MTTAPEGVETYPTRAADPLELPQSVVTALAGDVIPELPLVSGDRVFLVTRYDDCKAVLADRRFSRNVGRPEAAQLLPGVRMPSQPLADPPVHTRWRRQLAKAFTARRVQSLRPAIEDIVQGRLDRLEASGQPADLMQLVAFPVPIAVICALLELDPDEHAPFRRLAATALATDETSGEQKTEAFAGLSEMAATIIRARRAEPRGDLLSDLISAGSESSGSSHATPLTDEELVATVMTLLVGGYENPAHQIGKSIYALFRHPTQLAMLREDLSLVPAAVEETLRYVGAIDSGFGSPRFATADVVVGGTLLPTGATVLVNRQAANRDRRRFRDAERLDLRRDPAAHLVFGYGAHHCIGAALARLEFEILLDGLLRRFPKLRSGMDPALIPWAYRVTASGPAELPVCWI